MDKRFVAVIILALIVYFCNLGGNSVYILDEAKNVGSALGNGPEIDPVVVI